MQSIVAYLTAEAIVNEAQTIRTRSRKPGIVSRVRVSIARRFGGPASVDRTERYIEVPTLDGYPRAG